MFPAPVMNYEEYKRYNLSVYPHLRDWQIKVAYKYYISLLEGTQREINKRYNEIYYNDIYFFEDRFN
jgi:hypothetical protein